VQADTDSIAIKKPFKCFILKGFCFLTCRKARTADYWTKKYLANGRFSSLLCLAKPSSEAGGAKPVAINWAYRKRLVAAY
jgi:hypothetical protein